MDRSVRSSWRWGWLLAAALVLGGGCDGPYDWLPAVPSFSVTPVALENIVSIVPLGLPGTGGETKNRHQVVADGDVPAIPVFAPARGAVVLGFLRELPDGDTYFGVGIQVSPTVRVILDHLASPSSRIAAVLPQDGSSHVREEIVVEAGEQIGIIQPPASDVQAYAMDLVVLDEAHENTFVNQARYRQDDLLWGHLNGVCFEEFLEPSLVASWSALYGSGQPQPGLGCGSVSRDVAGTAAGMFFLDAAGDMTYGPQVAFADTGLDLKFNLGTTSSGFSGGDAQHFFDRTAHPAPEELLIGQEHCYAEMAPSTRWIYLRVNAPAEDPFETLDVVAGDGACPASLPGGGRRYRR